jgi:hypothetical protein
MDSVQVLAVTTDCTRARMSLSTKTLHTSLGFGRELPCRKPFRSSPSSLLRDQFRGRGISSRIHDKNGYEQGLLQRHATNSAIKVTSKARVTFRTSLEELKYGIQTIQSEANSRICSHLLRTFLLSKSRKTALREFHLSVSTVKSWPSSKGRSTAPDSDNTELSIYSMRHSGIAYAVGDVF